MSAPAAPCLTACLTAFSSKSNATTSWSESRRMRCTMLPPIFPSPTKPIWVTASCALGGGLRGHSISLIFAVNARSAPAGSSPVQAHALGRQLERAQRFQVADRLGVLKRRERERLAGDLDVLGSVVDQLQEAPGLRAALVELAGRVQEAGAVAERGRRAASPPGSSAAAPRRPRRARGRDLYKP